MESQTAENAGSDGPQGTRQKQKSIGRRLGTRLALEAVLQTCRLGSKSVRVDGWSELLRLESRVEIEIRRPRMADAARCATRKFPQTLRNADDAILCGSQTW